MHFSRKLLCRLLLVFDTDRKKFPHVDLSLEVGVLRASSNWADLCSAEKGSPLLHRSCKTRISFGIGLCLSWKVLLNARVAKSLCSRFVPFRPSNPGLGHNPRRGTKHRTGPDRTWTRKVEVLTYTSAVCRLNLDTRATTGRFVFLISDEKPRQLQHYVYSCHCVICRRPEIQLAKIRPKANVFYFLVMYAWEWKTQSNSSGTFKYCTQVL